MSEIRVPRILSCDQQYQWRCVWVKTIQTRGQISNRVIFSKDNKDLTPAKSMGVLWRDEGTVSVTGDRTVKISPGKGSGQLN